MSTSSRLVLLGLVTALAGCPDSHDTDDVGAAADVPVAPDAPSVPDDAPLDVPSDAPRDAPLDAPPVLGRLTFVVAALDLPQLDGAGRIAGVDLDRRVSTGDGTACSDALDFTSPITGAVGVDNQIGAHLVPILAPMVHEDGYPGMYRERLAAGRDLVVIDLTGVDSLTDDDSVEARVFAARTASGEPPLMIDGRVAPGQRFTEIAEWGAVPATITAGRLALRLDAWALAMAPDRANVLVRQLRLGARVSVDGLTEGEVGGHVLVAKDLELRLAAAGVDLGGTSAAEIVQPDLVGCEAASIGFTFEAVPAEGS